MSDLEWDDPARGEVYQQGWDAQPSAQNPYDQKTQPNKHGSWQAGREEWEEGFKA